MFTCSLLCTIVCRDVWTVNSWTFVYILIDIPLRTTSQVLDNFNLVICILWNQVRPMTVLNCPRLDLNPHVSDKSLKTTHEVDACKPKRDKQTDQCLQMYKNSMKIILSVAPKKYADKKPNLIVSLFNIFKIPNGHIWPLFLFLNIVSILNT